MSEPLRGVNELLSKTPLPPTPASANKRVRLLSGPKSVRPADVSGDTPGGMPGGTPGAAPSPNKQMLPPPPRESLPIVPSSVGKEISTIRSNSKTKVAAAAADAAKALLAAAKAQVVPAKRPAQLRPFNTDAVSPSPVEVGDFVDFVFSPPAGLKRAPNSTAATRSETSAPCCR